MLTELSVVEQRYLAVREVLDGAKVTDVATRYGVDRRTVHRWLVRHANGGLGALGDRSCKPDRCPHQIAPEIAGASSFALAFAGMIVGSLATQPPAKAAAIRA